MASIDATEHDLVISWEKLSPKLSTLSTRLGSCWTGGSGQDLPLLIKVSTYSHFNIGSAFTILMLRVEYNRKGHENVTVVSSYLSLVHRMS